MSQQNTDHCMLPKDEGTKAISYPIEAELKFPSCPFPFKACWVRHFSFLFNTEDTLDLHCLPVSHKNWTLGLYALNVKSNIYKYEQNTTVCRPDYACVQINSLY